MTAAPGPQQPDDEAAAVARAEERTAQVWDPCESDDNYDDARMELYLAFAAEERRSALAQSYEDDLGITPGTAVEARLLDIARELAGFPAATGPQQPDEVLREAELDAFAERCEGYLSKETYDRVKAARAAVAAARPAAPSAQPDSEQRARDLFLAAALEDQPGERPCDCVTPLPTGSLFYMGSHHQPGCAFQHAPAPAQPVRDTEEGRR